MGWSIGHDSTWNRDIGYGVPAFCDHPGCRNAIDRGLPYVCGGEPYDGEHGWGLFFCCQHMKRAGAARDYAQVCTRCRHGKPPYEPAPDHPEWIRWKLSDASWAPWREKHPEEVEALRVLLDQLEP